MWYNGVPPSGYPMEQVKQDPHNVDRVIARQMPYLCLIPLPVKTGWMSHPRALPVSRRAGVAAGHTPILRREDGRHAARVVGPRITMQARTCALWVTSYDKGFTLRGTEWVSIQGPSGPCGVIETAVFSSTLYDSHGQAIRFNRYQTQHRVTKTCPTMYSRRGQRIRLGPGETAVYRLRVYRL